jgi:Ser-tRNA(Ala) deacylase AlaX
MEGGVIITPTPFYAESGGQIGDTGTLVWESGRATVLDTQKVGELTMSRVRVDEGSLAPKTEVRASVPRDVRLDTTANHTATHLLHKALKDILGPTVQQAGSLVAPDRLRFDYTYHAPLTDEQIKAIEDAVNDRVRENLDVTKTVMPIEQAKKSGAVAMFGEKYGDEVRIVAAGEYSRELRRLPRESHRRHRHLQDHVGSLARGRRASHGGRDRPRRTRVPETRRHDARARGAGERRADELPVYVPRCRRSRSSSRRS